MTKAATTMRNLTRMIVLLSAGLIGVGVPAALCAADKPAIALRQGEGKLAITIDGKPFADYVYRDQRVLRPHFANVHAPSGVAVTRHHPPREGIDPTDHADLHPGIFLAFGDISGADFWRNRARVEHVEFITKPAIDGPTVKWTVKNAYRDGTRLVCTEKCKHRILIRPAGYLFLYDSQFRSDERPFVFGDQEEMGLGIRMATELRVKGGTGAIRNSDGRTNEEEVRGTNARWADYSGMIDGQRLGLTVMPDPRNFRASWYHARDYGFLAANPFGRQALTGGTKSAVAIEPGKVFALRFGVLVHSSPANEPLDLEAAYADYLEQAGVRKP